eukprot:818866-Prymnesium_polylepis.1
MPSKKALSIDVVNDYFHMPIVEAAGLRARALAQAPHYKNPCALSGDTPHETCGIQGHLDNLCMHHLCRSPRRMHHCPQEALSETWHPSMACPQAGEPES